MPEVGRADSWARAGLRPVRRTTFGGWRDPDVEGLVWATGHWRNGVLLAPLTGDCVAALLEDGGSGSGAGRAVARPLRARGGRR